MRGQRCFRHARLSDARLAREQKETALSGGGPVEPIRRGPAAPAHVRRARRFPPSRKRTTPMPRARPSCAGPAALDRLRSECRPWRLGPRAPRSNAARTLPERDRRSRRWVCSWTHATRALRRSVYAVRARSTGWVASSWPARGRPRPPAPRPAPCSVNWRGRRRRRGRRGVLSIPEEQPPRWARNTPWRHARADAARGLRSRRTVAPVLAAGAVRDARVAVGVAVHESLAERDREERAASAKHDRPIGDVGEARGEETPACLSDEASGWTAQDEAADRRMDSVRADDQVVAAG